MTVNSHTQRPPARSSDKVRLILTGGGTSGHVNPALAMGQAVEKLSGGAESLFIGVKGRVEEKVVPKAGLPIHFVPSAPFASPRKPVAFAKFAFNIVRGIIKAIGIIRRFKPDHLLATGGYAAAPAVMALAGMKALGLTKAAISIHEANAVPGRLNRLMGRQADHLFLTFPQSLAYVQTPKGAGKTRVVGYPVRQTLTRLPKEEARKRLGLNLPPEAKLVLVFGGSQGARTINMAVAGALADLIETPDLFILHGVGYGSEEHKPWTETGAELTRLHGPDWADKLAGRYRAEVYLDDMAAAYSAADLVICRAGAGSIFEVCSLAAPTLLIPKPNLPGDHQVHNARSLASAGGADVLYEDLAFKNGGLTSWIDPGALAARIIALLGQPELLADMGRQARKFMTPGAAELIAGIILGRVDQEAEPEREILPPPPGHAALLGRLQRSYNASPPNYNPSWEIDDLDLLAYFRYRSAMLLTSPDWTRRNIGVKLIGLLQDKSKISHLLALIADRTPTGPLKRFCGGDYVQVGFIRRNAVTSLRIIGLNTLEVENTLALAMTDNYFEVRSEAAKTIGAFAHHLNDPDRMETLLIKALADKSFEVIREACRALGRAGLGERAVEALLALQLHRYWQVRQEAMTSLARMVKRGAAPDVAEIKRRMSGFVTTATDFSPHFSIKAAYNGLVRAVEQEKTP